MRLVKQPVEMAITGSDIAQVEQPAITSIPVTPKIAPWPACLLGMRSRPVWRFPEKPGEPISRVDVAQRAELHRCRPVPEDADYFSIVQIARGRPDTGAG